MMKGFVAYSRTDTRTIDGLMVHLKGLEREGVIETWHDRQLVPGEEWDTRIRSELAEATVIIFCVSADLLANEYVQKVEIPMAIARRDREEATVIPVILRQCAWQSHALGRLQGIPAKGRTVQDYIRNDNTDEVWTEVAYAVRGAVRARRKVGPHARFALESKERRRHVGAGPVAGYGEVTDLERYDFVRSTFAIIMKYFENSLEDLKKADAGCTFRLQKLSEGAFDVSVYVNGRRRSFCGISIDRRLAPDGIDYSTDGGAERVSFNALRLASGEHGKRLRWLSLMGTMPCAPDIDANDMDPMEAAVYLWSYFVST